MLNDMAEPAAERVIAGRYRVVRTLGRGGSATTYEAEDLESERRVAVKELSLRGVDDWKVLELFEREAQVLARLEHPGIPRYHAHFHEDTDGDRVFYIVQELAEGRTLDALVRGGWRPDEAEVRDLAAKLLTILAYLQSLTPPVVHRDLKPQNVVRGEDGRVFLVDFGSIQQVHAHTLTGGSMFVGTHGYMPPEQAHGQASPASDLYGLGSTLLFVLLGDSPATLLQRRLKPQFRDKVRVSEPFARWLERMLEPAAEDRFSDAQAALAALRGAPWTEASRVPPHVVVVAAAVLALAIGTATTLALRPWGAPPPPPPTVVSAHAPSVVPSPPTSWRELLRSGQPVDVVLDETHGKFDDTKFTGDYRTDPLGTLKGGETYVVTYDAKQRSFETTGFNQGRNAVATVSYPNGDLDKNEISLWGLLVHFDPKTGEVTEPQWGLVGHLRASSPTLAPSFALQALVARPPLPDGTYLADATVVRVQVCHCPVGSKCDCDPDSLVVTNDAADSAAWPLRARGLGDLERRFKIGARYRLTVRVDHGEPLVVDAVAQ